MLSSSTNLDFNPLPRPRSHTLHDQWKISLPATVAATIDNLLIDPLRGKPRYAARSRLVEQLLRRFIRENDLTLASPPLTDEAIDAIGTTTLEPNDEH